VVACVAVAASGVTERLDQRALDLEFSLLHRWLPRAAPREVVVVGIDEQSTAALPEPIALYHNHLARFLDQMRIAQPAAVGIDLTLPDRSFDRVQPGLDMRLTRSIVEARRAYPLVLALTVDADNVTRDVHRPFLAAAGPDGAEHAVFPIDADGAIRRTVPRSLAGQMARRLGVEPRSGLIDFSRGAPFRYVPFHEMLEWDAERLQREFRGKPVLLGVAIPHTDEHRVPARLSALDAADPPRAPGVMLHAQQLRNLLGDGLVRPAPTWLVALVGASAAALLHAPWAVVAAIPAAFLATLALLAAGWSFPFAAIAAATLVPLGVHLAERVAERRRLSASFKGYVSPSVMHEILAGRIQPDLTGVRRFVCVMFADIRGYTARAQEMRPEEVIRFLNRYFERVVAIVHAHGGTVISFMGDGIMVAFGTPRPLDNPCRAAFDTALDMQAFVAELSASLAAEGAPPIDIGIGLNAGEALCGHVGSPERHEYSAIGDVTNVASRLQSLTKEQGYRILISAEVARFLQRNDLQPLGALPIRGHAPVEAFGYGGTKP
jgi:class 3 adenylate cyclase/CHASE2 domain-containing sensor protein